MKKQNKERIIVSFTSWVNRIKRDIRPVINSILEGSLVPDEMILNLSEEEWAACEDNDALAALHCLKELAEDPKLPFSINMVAGPNTKCFKKFLPILDEHKNDIIITIDDDILYPHEFVEQMVKKFKEDETRPVTVNYYNYNGLIVMWGGGALYKASFLEGWEDIITDEIISTYEDDWFYTYVMLKNGIKLRLCPDEIYYDPFIYRQYTYDDQMFVEGGYNNRHTVEVLNKRFVELGYDVDELVESLFKKYKYDI